MAGPAKHPVTPAVRVLREHGIAFTPHLYRYEEKVRPADAAALLGIPPHAMVKTIVLEDDRGQGLICLQHVDREISTRELARAIGARAIEACTPERVTRLTGYLVGGCSPFGTRQPLPVYVEASVMELPELYINGGKRGFLVALRPADLEAVLHPVRVSVAIDRRTPG
jgi:Cys-tRNA(Pro) deacylase